MSGVSPLRRRTGIAIPSQCRELIERGALVAVSSSGGKDSQAMTILLSRIVPPEQMIVVHAPLGEVEWPGTLVSLDTVAGVDGFSARASQDRRLSASQCNANGLSGPSIPHALRFACAWKLRPVKRLARCGHVQVHHIDVPGLRAFGQGSYFFATRLPG